jgi:hypothetical protein
MANVWLEVEDPDDLDRPRWAPSHRGGRADLHVTMGRNVHLVLSPPAARRFGEFLLAMTDQEE